MYFCLVTTVRGSLGVALGSSGLACPTSRSTLISPLAVLPQEGRGLAPGPGRGGFYKQIFSIYLLIHLGYGNLYLLLL